jgi:hypothetical protein
MDTDRVQELDKKIKRYEGIDVLLDRALHKAEMDAVNREEAGGADLNNSGTEKNERS